jgi:hypothetical protein
VTDVIPGDTVTLVPALLPSVLIFREAVDVAQIVKAVIQTVPVGSSSKDTFVEMRLDGITVFDTAVVTIGPGEGVAEIPGSLAKFGSLGVEFKFSCFITVSTISVTIATADTSLSLSTSGFPFAIDMIDINVDIKRIGIDIGLDDSVSDSHFSIDEFVLGQEINISLDLSVSNLGLGVNIDTILRFDVSSNLEIVSEIDKGINDFSILGEKIEIDDGVLSWTEINEAIISEQAFE